MYEKITIVGAGPSGSSAAIRLLEKDPSKEITIYEKRREIGSPARCAGGLHGSRAKALGIEVPKDVIVSKVQRFIFRSPHQQAEFSLEKLGFKGDYWTIDRTKFDQYLAKRAEELGAKIVTNANVIPFSTGNSTINQIESDGSVTITPLKYDVLIAAAGFQEGLFSEQYSTQKVKPKDIAVCLQYTMRIPDYPQDTMEVWFGENFAPGGYIWTFPGGYPDVRIGLGLPAEKHCNTRKLLDKMVDFLGWTKGENFKECIGRTLPSTKLPQTGLLQNNILLVGDQLHVTDPLTGGGIIPAILTGRAAADAILMEDLSAYDGLWKSLVKENNIRYKAKKLFEMSDEKLDRLVTLVSEFQPKDLTPGTEVKQLLKHLVRRDPFLFVSLLRVLL